VPVDDMTQACAAACTPTCEAPPVKVARVQFDPARGLPAGTFGDGVTMESADPRELAGRMVAHGATHAHVGMPDWREGDTAPASCHRIAFHARLNELGRTAMTDAERLALRQAVPVHAHGGRPYYVCLVEIPAPWQDAFRVALRGSAAPVIDGRGECAYVWDWADWLHGRLPHG
jgi:hypothetical protein